MTSPGACPHPYVKQREIGARFRRITINLVRVDRQNWPEMERGLPRAACWAPAACPRFLASRCQERTQSRLLELNACGRRRLSPPGRMACPATALGLRGLGLGRSRGTYRPAMPLRPPQRRQPVRPGSLPVVVASSAAASPAPPNGSDGTGASPAPQQGGQASSQEPPPSAVPELQITGQSVCFCWAGCEKQNNN